MIQQDLWMLEKLKELFGGTISHRKRSGISNKDYRLWRISGARARGFAMTIYKFLSPRRQEQLRKHGLL